MEERGEKRERHRGEPLTSDMGSGSGNSVLTLTAHTLLLESYGSG